MKARLLLHLAAHVQTKAERARILHKPWILIDIGVLLISWAYLVEPLRIFSIGRVLRVLRPLRTLRMLSDIQTVLETIVDALPLFGQACLLVLFLLMAYALTGMSLWTGGLHYQCSPKPININASEPVWGLTCPACLPCGDTAGRCDRLPAEPFIRSEEYGFTGFDNFVQAMLTMFVQMTGDNGMQDIPFALGQAGVVLNGFGWPMMASGVIILTILALNLFLAVCCSVFDEVHDKVTVQKHEVVKRDEAYTSGFGDFGKNASPLLGS